MFAKKTLTCALGLLLFGYAPMQDNKQEGQNPNSFNEVSFQLPKRDSLEICLDSLYNFNEKELNKFNSWIDSTINTSRINNDYAIIVNKSEYKLFVYKDGRKQMELPIDLGKNPYDDKRMQGDKTTPEGMYKVSLKVPQGKSDYYEGFMINYPNAQDAEEFRRMVESGEIPDSSRIGGSIAIHGNGTGLPSSKRTKKAIKDYKLNWTYGCMALSDKDMDKIYYLVPAGTPVTIVRFTDKRL